jgi:hypothetical protein
MTIFRSQHHAHLYVSSRMVAPLPVKMFADLVQAHAGLNLAAQIDLCLPPHSQESPNEKHFWELCAGHPDLWFADFERTQLTLDDLVGLKERAAFPAQAGQKRVFVIFGAHRLTVSAANSLLKTLEEPPVPTLYLLTARSRESVLPTISSRCLTQALLNLPLPAERPLSMPEIDAQKLIEASQAFDPLKANTELLSKNARLYFKVAEELSKELNSTALLDFWARAGSLMAGSGRWDLVSLRFYQKELRDWAAMLNFNPSSQFWNLRLLLSLK